MPAPIDPVGRPAAHGISVARQHVRDALSIVSTLLVDEVHGPDDEVLHGANDHLREALNKLLDLRETFRELASDFCIDDD